MTPNSKIDYSLRTTSVLALDLQRPLMLDQSVTVADVISAMRKHALGYALLVSEARVSGIFTERDVFLRVIGQPGQLSRPVAALMSTPPVCLGAGATIGEALERMHDHGLRQLPVCDADGGVLACVRHEDIAGYLVSHFAGQVLNLPPDPEQRARLPEGG